MDPAGQKLAFFRPLLKRLPTSFLFIPPSSSLNHPSHQHWNGFTYRSSLASLVPPRDYKHRIRLFVDKIQSTHVMTTSISPTPVAESPILCSIDQCATPFDVHCFHCRTNMCSHHYFEHKQQQLTTENDEAMDDLLQLASSKCFCISNNGYSTSKQRRTLSNPFVSSGYLLKKMRQQAAARRPSNIKPIITTKTTAIKLYNLRKRPGKRPRNLVATKTTTVTTTTVQFCRTILKSRLRNNKLCNRKLPCPYHPSQSS